jgi:hypothetical protein
MFEAAVNVSPAESLNRRAKLKDLFYQETARMQSTQDRLDILTDNWEEQIIDRIRPRVKKETLTKLQWYSDISDNPYKNIIGQLSGAYSKDPARTFPKVSKEIASAYSDWYIKKGVNQVMEKAQRYMNATNDLLIYLQRVGDEVEPRLLTGNVVVIEGKDEDPTVPEVVYIQYLINEKDTATIANTYWVVWTEFYHFKIDKDGIERAVGDNTDMVNPWGVMPFVYLHRELPVDTFFDQTSGGDLTALAVSTGERGTMDGFSRFLSNFKQGAITGEFDDPPADLLLNPDNLVGVHGTDVEITMLDWQLNYEALERDIRQKKERTGQNYGVDIGGGEANQEQSGVAYVLKNQKLMEHREKQIKIMARAEVEMFALKLKMDAVIAGKDAPDKVEFAIKYPEPEVYIEPMVELQIQEKEILMDLLSKVDVYMKRNQVSDRDKAIEALQRIQKENEMFTDRVIMNELNRQEEGD